MEVNTSPNRSPARSLSRESIHASDSPLGGSRKGSVESDWSSRPGSLNGKKRDYYQDDSDFLRELEAELSSEIPGEEMVTNQRKVSIPAGRAGRTTTLPAKTLFEDEDSLFENFSGNGSPGKRDLSAVSEIEQDKKETEKAIRSTSIGLAYSESTRSLDDNSNSQMNDGSAAAVLPKKLEKSISTVRQKLSNIGINSLSTVKELFGSDEENLPRLGSKESNISYSPTLRSPTSRSLDILDRSKNNEIFLANKVSDGSLDDDLELGAIPFDDMNDDGSRFGQFVSKQNWRSVSGKLGDLDIMHPIGYDPQSMEPSMDSRTGMAESLLEGSRHFNRSTSMTDEIVQIRSLESRLDALGLVIDDAVDDVPTEGGSLVECSIQQEQQEQQQQPLRTNIASNGSEGAENNALSSNRRDSMNSIGSTDSPVTNHTSPRLRRASLFEQDANTQTNGLSAHNVPKKSPKSKQTFPKEISYQDFVYKLAHHTCSAIVETIWKFITSILGPYGDGSGADEATALGIQMIPIKELPRSINSFLETMVDHLVKLPMWRGDPEDQRAIARDYLEAYIMKRIAVVAFRAVEVSHEDASLTRRMKLLSFLEPSNLDINVNMCNDMVWAIARDELRQINSFKTPEDKVNCIIKSSAVLFRSLNLARAKNGSTNSDGATGADDFFPAFIWVTLTSHISNLQSNCEYIQAYHNPFRLMGRAGYCFVSLCSAIEFINTLDAESVTMDAAEFKQKFENAELALANN